ncbi:MAG: site-specific DNA-methyltransferase [Bacteroidia bacterium]|nr:site-specific DNA-methyltransferase [Bacteroidia bacterium]MDW8303150.1 site-specific DNA-methyltransferase [Bacteroidia bacterium]
MEYKKIEIEPHTTILSTEWNQAKNIMSKYPKEDIYCKYRANKIEVFLRQLDFYAFKKDVEQAAKNNPKLDFLLRIFEAIDRIKSYGIKNGKRLYVEYDAEKKVLHREEKEKKRSVAFYAVESGFEKQNQALPISFENQIICGDSEQVLKDIPDNCIDLIITSPPYNFGLDYAQSQDDYHWQHYFDKLFRIFEECIRVLKYSGRIAINVQPLYSDYIPTHHFISNFFTARKMIWKTEILWQKNNYSAKFSSWGSWKSPSSPYFKTTWEYIEVFCKGDLKKQGKKEDIDITEEEFKKWVNAAWNIAPERNMDKFDHPAMFPEELVKRLIKLFSYQNDVVLDPFNGAGTTTYVAKILNRRFVGIDISEKYCQTARERLRSLLVV